MSNHTNPEANEDDGDVSEQESESEWGFSFRQPKTPCATLMDVLVSVYTPGDNSSAVQLPVQFLYTTDLPADSASGVFSQDGNPRIMLGGQGDLTELVEPLHEHSMIRLVFAYSRFRGSIGGVSVDMSGDLRDTGESGTGTGGGGGGGDGDTAGVLDTHITVGIESGRFIFDGAGSGNSAGSARSE